MTSVVTTLRRGVNASQAVKVPVVAATTANITLSGEQTIDGVACVTDDRVLVKDQTDASENGIYEVDTSTWTRTPDWDGSSDIVKGTYVYAAGGTVGNNFWQVTTSNTITIGEDDVAFQATDPDSLLRSNLADTSNGQGASLVGIEDSAGNFTATTVEAALAEILADLALTTASNGASLVGIQDSAGYYTATTVEAALAEIYKKTLVKGADVASAAALTLGTDGNYFDITGTTSITSIGTLGIGRIVKLHFDDVLTITHHATDLVCLGGADVTTAAGDEGEFVEYATGDWRMTNFQRASGVPLSANGTVITQGTLQDISGGATTHDWTSIPSWVKRITVMIDGLSTNGTSHPIIQLGDAGGFETSGYLSMVGQIDNGPFNQGSTSGLIVSRGDASNVEQGTITLTLMNAATYLWTAAGVVTDNTDSFVSPSAGRKALSDTLTQIRLTTENGTDTFDAGSVNILYE